jgi:hypothetical protein
VLGSPYEDGQYLCRRENGDKLACEESECDADAVLGQRRPISRTHAYPCQRPQRAERLYGNIHVEYRTEGRTNLMRESWQSAALQMPSSLYALQAGACSGLTLDIGDTERVFCLIVMLLLLSASGSITSENEHPLVDRFSHGPRLCSSPCRPTPPS